MKVINKSYVAKKKDNDSNVDKHKIWLIAGISIAVLIVAMIFLYPAFKEGFGGKAVAYEIKPSGTNSVTNDNEDKCTGGNKLYAKTNSYLDNTFQSTAGKCCYFGKTIVIKTSYYASTTCYDKSTDQCFSGVMSGNKLCLEVEEGDYNRGPSGYNYAQIQICNQNTKNKILYSYYPMVSEKVKISDLSDMYCNGDKWIKCENKMNINNKVYDNTKGEYFCDQDYVCNGNKWIAVSAHPEKDTKECKNYQWVAKAAVPVPTPKEKETTTQTSSCGSLKPGETCITESLLYVFNLPGETNKWSTFGTVSSGTIGKSTDSNACVLKDEGIKLDSATVPQINEKSELWSTLLCHNNHWYRCNEDATLQTPPFDPFNYCISNQWKKCGPANLNTHTANGRLCTAKGWVVCNSGTKYSMSDNNKWICDTIWESCSLGGSNDGKVIGNYKCSDGTWKVAPTYTKVGQQALPPQQISQPTTPVIQEVITLKTEINCADGKDDETIKDGLIDCADLDCKNNPLKTECQPGGSVTISGMTNSDALKECLKRGYTKVSPPINGIYTCSFSEDCDNEIDDDGDKKVDCADSECNNKPGNNKGNLCQFGQEKNCNDGFDNDRDGVVAATTFGRVNVGNRVVQASEIYAAVSNNIVGRGIKVNTENIDIVKATIEVNDIPEIDPCKLLDCYIFNLDNDLALITTTNSVQVVDTAKWAKFPTAQGARTKTQIKTAASTDIQVKIGTNEQIGIKSIAQSLNIAKTQMKSSFITGGVVASSTGTDCADTDCASDPACNVITCTDSDGGNDFLTKGTIVSNDYPAGKEDYCYTTATGKTYLYEGRCDNNKYAVMYKNCGELVPYNSYTCQDGACKTTTIQVTTVNPATDSPAVGNVNPGQKDVTLAKFNLAGEKVVKLSVSNGLTITDPDFETVKIYKDGLLLSSGKLVSGLFDPGVSLALLKGKTTVITIKADISANANIGDKIKLGLRVDGSPSYFGNEQTVVAVKVECPSADWSNVCCEFGPLQFMDFINAFNSGSADYGPLDFMNFINKFNAGESLCTK